MSCQLPQTNVVKGFVTDASCPRLKSNRCPGQLYCYTVLLTLPVRYQYQRVWHAAARISIFPAPNLLRTPVLSSLRWAALPTAQSLGRDGASVMLSDIDDSAADTAVSRLSEQGIKAVYTHCDVSKRDQVQHLISQTVQQLGGVDIMVANAGIVRSAPFLEMSEEDFDAVIAVNLKGVFLTCQAAAQQMVKQGGAMIIGLINAGDHSP
eukprot:GHUV01041352.1.p1 GENE.GHUV01041352.1~~GHUV01041352.1.p1  ORF type:complete len:208 (+),score=34.21 GHUV01041352.1:309-932(+)